MSSSPRQKHTDTWVDRFLDRLRDAPRIPCESLLSWGAAVACWLFYSVSYQRRKKLTALVDLPLVTIPSLSQTQDAEKENEKENEAMAALQSLTDTHSTEDWITAIRGQLVLRRQISELVQRQQRNKENNKKLDHEASTPAFSYDSLYHTLQAQWKRLLELPPLPATLLSSSSSCLSTTSTTSSSSTCCISLILPAFGETGAQVAQTLQQAWEMQQQQQQSSSRQTDDNGNNDNQQRSRVAVQVIVVDAGRCDENLTREFLQKTLATNTGYANTIELVRAGGGRGPALNAGAQVAKGDILTFLHSDTYLPPNWDVQIVKVLQQQQPNKNNSDEAKIVQACAFSFGHHLSSKSPLPGLGAVQWLGNRRALDCHLPYGDHVISMPAVYFRYLGGFPEQPIMEDFALMHLLRQRAAVLPNEEIRIIPPPSAQCSVRRWEKLGVLYVTLTNALIVYRYTYGNWTANDVFDYYYKRS